MVPPTTAAAGLTDSVSAARRALVVEDDEDIRSLIEFTLSSQGFDVQSVGTGHAALDLIASLDPDLVTLDLGLPGIDGIETCRQIRSVSDAYVVMITARDEEIDRLIGLETGADDYLSKPFHVRELRARVNAMFRRPRRLAGAPLQAAPSPPRRCPGLRRATAVAAGPVPGHDHEVLTHGTLRVDVDGRVAFRGDDELTLTRTEFDLLVALMRSPARVWSRESLLRSVWDTEWASDTHLVEVHVGNLRRKLGERPGGPRFVRTVRGVGYRMESVA